MLSMRHHFSALFGKVNPSEERLAVAAALPGELRAWLKEHDFETRSPHTRLIGSYGRQTAILDIKDVDVLLFVPDAELGRTPNAILREIAGILSEYPHATTEASGQRRSVRLDFPEHELVLDIVPAILDGGLEERLKVPDRPKEEWIDSDPLGYGRRLSSVNEQSSGKLVPLVKLVKAWRDVQMKIRRPKSYALEVMTLYAAEDESLTFDGESMESVVAQFFGHIAQKYKDLMEKGTESPRIRDPQISDHFITNGWSRQHFETFMRRIREADRAAQRALAAETVEDKDKRWQLVFGELWPSGDEVKAAARLEAAKKQPGAAFVGPSPSFSPDIKKGLPFVL